MQPYTIPIEERTDTSLWIINYIIGILHRHTVTVTVRGGSVWTYVRVDLLSVFWGPESIFVLSTFQCLLTVARLQTNTHRPNRTPVKAVTMQLNKTRRHLRLIHLLSLQRATSVNLTPAPNLPCFPSNEVARILRHSARRSTLATSSITTFYTLLLPAPIVPVTKNLVPICQRLVAVLCRLARLPPALASLLSPHSHFGDSPIKAPSALGPFRTSLFTFLYDALYNEQMLLDLSHRSQPNSRLEADPKRQGYMRGCWKTTVQRVLSSGVGWRAMQVGRWIQSADSMLGEQEIQENSSSELQDVVGDSHQEELS
ncbi:hypothetical protein R3P38DRAFT_2787528 [Favolaschia claudopus]|uniref:Uncharacterized protein n=1 Tax=Favolaschia claudopus TaxID=2862362 RepID=A0AAW0ANI5_9AGAR